MLFDNWRSARKLVSARFQLNSLGGASQLAMLGASPYWRESAASVHAAAPPSPELASLTINDMHDIFDISPAQLRVVDTVLERLAVAERAGPSVIIERTIREIAYLPARQTASICIPTACLPLRGVGLNSLWHGRRTLVRDDALSLDFAAKLVVPRDAEAAARLANEIELMRRLRHENIVQYIGEARCGGERYILLEYCSGGSVRQLLESEFRQGLPHHLLASYATQLLHGLHFLHEHL